MSCALTALLSCVIRGRGPGRLPTRSESWKQVPDAVAIERIGSTSISGRAVKLCIDVMIVVADLEASSAVVNPTAPGAESGNVLRPQRLRRHHQSRSARARQIDTAVADIADRWICPHADASPLDSSDTSPRIHAGRTRRCCPGSACKATIESCGGRCSGNHGSSTALADPTELVAGLRRGLQADAFEATKLAGGDARQVAATSRMRRRDCRRVEDPSRSRLAGARVRFARVAPRVGDSTIAPSLLIAALL